MIFFFLSLLTQSNYQKKVLKQLVIKFTRLVLKKLSFIIFFYLVSALLLYGRLQLTVIYKFE